MKKTVFLLNIGDYAPEITAMTYPLIERWAKKIGAGVQIIAQRKFPEWDLDYEKLQIYELSEQMGNDWNIYIDSDAVVHPDLPDFTEMIPRDTVLHNGSDFAPARWRYDKYFRRDGRHIGSCNWLACASSWCTDLWRPLDDMTMEQAAANITPINHELKTVITAEHLVSDYALSRNIARFGLKFTTLQALWKSHGLEQPSPDPPHNIVKPNFFYHEYTLTRQEKAVRLKEIIKKWELA